MDKRPNTVRTNKKLQVTDKAEMTCKHNLKHAQKQTFQRQTAWHDVQQQISTEM